MNLSYHISNFVSGWLLYIYLGTAFVSLYCTGFVNIGISGQLVLSAVTTCYLSQIVPHPFIAIVFALPTTFIWLYLGVWLKVKYRVNEIIFTLFMNYLTINSLQFIMQSTNPQLQAVCTPPVPEGFFHDLLDVKSRLSFIGNVTNNFSSYHLMAIVFLAFLVYYNKHSIIGHKASMLAQNPEILSGDSALKVMTYPVAISSVATCLYVTSDIGFYQKVYTSGSYDLLGFKGILIGLLAAGQYSQLPVASCVVALIDAVVFYLQGEFGIPQMTSHFLYGAGILASAFYRHNKECN